MQSTATHRPAPIPPTAAELIRSSVANQAIEGYHSRPDEIDRAKKRLEEKMARPNPFR